MTQEEKQLLLKDLCARLPYGVILDNPNPCGEHWDELISIDIPNGTVTLLYDGRTYKVEKTKPYLRPMSSMTDEEREELSCYENSIQRADFYYSHHIDCRFMIEKGLAIEAPEGMYMSYNEKPPTTEDIIKKRDESIRKYGHFFKNKDE